MEIIKETVKKSGLDVKIEFIKEFDDSKENPGRYDEKTKTIIIAVNALEHTFRKFQPYIKDLTREDVYQIVAGHELGHANDKNLYNANEKMLTILTEVYDLVKKGQVREIKGLFKKVANAYMQKERIAWEYTNQFFVKEMDAHKVKVMKDYYLNVHLQSMLKQFKELWLSAKLFDKMKKWDGFNLYFPLNIKLSLDARTFDKSHYDKENNRYQIGLKHILQNKQQELKNSVSSANYVFYEMLYIFSKNKRHSKEKEVEAFRMDAYQETLVGDEYSGKTLEFLQTYKEKALFLEECILEDVEITFFQNNSFDLFKKNKLKIKEKEVNKTENLYLLVYETSISERKEEMIK